ncbi:MAG: hypothetical protein WD231_02080 [Candidatus Woykebacteria bacterium]
MKFKIGIFGSAEGGSDKAKQLAKNLAEHLSNHNVTILTGAGSGIPYEVAVGVAKKGVEVWGYSPSISFKQHKSFYPSHDLSVYNKLFFIPKDYEFSDNKDVMRKYRNVTSTATCDAGIIISGRWGSMNEFTNLYDMGKIIGVLTGTGGIADKLDSLTKKISKESKAKVIFESSPEKLVKELISLLENK